jgi:hypothetical protein
VSLGTEKEECGEDKLILIPAAVLTMWSIVMMMIEKRGNYV